MSALSKLLVLWLSAPRVTKGFVWGTCLSHKLKTRQQSCRAYTTHLCAETDSSTTTRRSALISSALGGLGILSLTQQPEVACAAQSKSVPSLDARAPDFDLPNSRGQKVSLDTFISANKWTVLYFFPGAFTSGCTLEARGFQKDLDEYRKLNSQIVGVSVDSVEKNAQFCSAEGLDFYMLTDLNGSVSKSYGSALSIPGIGTFSNRHTYIIDPKGNLQWVFIDVESHVARHSQEVLEKLLELQQTVS